MTDTLPAISATATAGKYLTFNLAKEVYGIRVLHVREIVAITSITAVPKTPRFIKGVMNLRGKIVPLIDLHLKFQMDSCDYTRETCVVVVEVSGTRGKMLLGVIVDSVRDVMDVTASEIADVPQFGVQVDTAYLSGMANTKNDLILLLDIEHVLSRDELTAVELTPITEIESNDADATSVDQE